MTLQCNIAQIPVNLLCFKFYYIIQIIKGKFKSIYSFICCKISSNFVSPGVPKFLSTIAPNYPQWKKKVRKMGRKV